MKTKVSGGNTTTYGWDFESHLTSIDYPGTSNDGSHEYDGHGLRMRSKLAGAANWTNFVWDDLTHELLAEYTLISGSFTIKALNTYGLGLISSNREGTKRYFHFDALGSTAALDDENETLKDSYTYEAFGVVQTATSSNGPSTNPFTFRGRFAVYDDEAMGCALSAYSLTSRTYIRTAGRFMSLPYAVVVDDVEPPSVHAVVLTAFQLPHLIFPTPGQSGPGPKPVDVIVIGSCPLSVRGRCIEECARFNLLARCVATNVGYFCYCDPPGDGNCGPLARRWCEDFCRNRGQVMGFCRGNLQYPKGTWHPQVCICKKRSPAPDGP